MTESPRIFCIDVCGTLFSANTTAGFTMFHHKLNGNHFWTNTLAAITNRQQPLRYAFALLGLVTRFDFHRWIVLRSLKGQERCSLEASATSYLESLKLLKIEVVHKIVAEKVEQGWSPILVSNGIDLVIEPIAASLNMPWISSRLNWRGSKCAGTLSQDLTGRKRVGLEDRLGVTLTEVEFGVITDNQSDGDLLKIARPAYLVVSGRMKNWMKEYYAEIIQC